MANANITESQAVTIGLWLDDPYGDGIRLQAIHEPSAERIAAIEFKQTGQRTIENLEAVYIDRGYAAAKDKKMMRVIARNGVI